LLGQSDRSARTHGGGAGGDVALCRTGDAQIIAGHGISNFPKLVIRIGRTHCHVIGMCLHPVRMISPMTTSLHLSRRQIIAAASSTIAGVSIVRPVVAATEKPNVLVELFTSQGCSSCPAADRLAAKLAKRKDVLVLSFNVDYWDYLGWRDTLAKPEYSQRQYDYARTRGDSNVYTPQMIFNGAAHVVGSQSRAVEQAIETAAANPVSVRLQVTDKEVSVAIPAQASTTESTLWLMAVASEKPQEIERGENAGETVVYHNVVRNLVPAAMWKGEVYSGSWMHDAVMTKDSDFCVAVLQEGKTGRVLAIARS
jgi:hypothetical protein